VELLENARLVLFGNARACIRYAYSEVAIRDHGLHPYFSSVRELDGVTHEVEQHLREALLVAEANRERLVHGRRERELLVLGERLSGGAHRLDHALDGVFGHVQGELAGFDLGNVQHSVDEAQQVFAVGADAGEGIE
jgi:hypothetical protein